MIPFLLALAFAHPAVWPPPRPTRSVMAADVPGEFVVTCGGEDCHFICWPGGMYYSPFAAGWRGCWRVRAGELQIAEWHAYMPAPRAIYWRVPLRRSAAGKLERWGLPCERMPAWDLRAP